MDNNVFIHPTAVVDEGAILGEGTKIWHFSHIMQESIVGKFCNIGQNVVISPGVVLGSNVKIQNNVSLYTGVICEDDVFLGPSCVFTNVVNPRSAINRRGQYAQTRVGKGASIGKRALKIKVIKLDGKEPNIGDYFIRWIFRFIDIVISFGTLAIFSISFISHGFPKT